MPDPEFPEVPMEHIGHHTEDHGAPNPVSALAFWRAAAVRCASKPDPSGYNLLPFVPQADLDALPT